MKAHFQKHFFPVLAFLLLFTVGARAQTPPGNSLNFNGVNQYVQVASFGTIVPTNEITVEVWVYANVIAGQKALAMNFGVSNAVPGTYSVQYSTNLLNWYYLGPATPRYSFIDSNAPANPQRYYRLTHP